MTRVHTLTIIASVLPCFCYAAPFDSLSEESLLETMLPSDSSISHEPVLVAGILPKDGEAMYELEFWNSIKNSTFAEDYEAYLKAYPNGRFAPLAKSRIKRYSDTKPVKKQPKAKFSFKINPLTDQYLATANSNVRSIPSKRANIIGDIKKGSRVNVTGKVDNKNWFRVAMPNGESGYVYATLLSKLEPKKPKKTIDKPLPKVVPPVNVEVTTFKDCPQCPEMVSIPPGQFQMGDNRGDRSERPAHKVTIRRPFAIGKYEITVAQWQACVDAGGCEKVSDAVQNSDNSPIRDISWSDAQSYITWLSTLTNQTYRLPTEAEWEYAARGGSKATYWWGNSMLPGKANCKDCGNNYDPSAPSQVGSFEANPFGLHDMNGNVWEWVSDCWHRNYNGAPRDGRSWDATNCTVRVIRSGSWKNDKSYVHSASRFKYDAYVRYIQNGFRVAKSLE